ncbi:MAG: signal recognition particle-docking protein FtsY [Parvularculaceae bacterium]|nr:signal recognition particle-docking protein FtsY [Parvularculaceae bacterium]
MAKGFLTGLFGRKPLGGDAAATADRPDASPAAAPVPPVHEPADRNDRGEPARKGFFARLADGLSKTSSKLSGDVAALFNKRKLDAATLEELEEILIAADLGLPAAVRVVEALAKDRFEREISDVDVRAALAREVARTLAEFERPLLVDRNRRPFVILMVGVNGSGKTTTIGKLAEKFRREGRSVVIAAGDTFRAAAIEQLQVWGARAGAEVVSRAVGADAAGLAFDALKAARDAGAEVLLIDTAGRLQNRKELMDELAKIVRVLKKIDPDAPHATILTLDATVGQNALAQAEAFKEIAGVNGLIMTKLDGTARGGILVAIAEKHKIPVHFIGVGEAVDDLQPFHAETFARAIAGLPPAPAA